MSLAPSDVWIIVLAAAWGFIPGLALALALGVRDWVVLVGTAVPVGIALNTLASEAAALVGTWYSPWSALGTSVFVVVVTAAVRQVLRGRIRTAASTNLRVDTEPDGIFGAERKRVRLLLNGAGGASLVFAPVLAVATWWRGIGPLSTYNQDHDSINHQVLVAYILRTGRAAPWQVLPGDLLTGASPHPYPAGLHRLAALVGAAAGDPISGLNATLIVLCGVAWTLSAAALTAGVLRTTNAAACWQLAGAGITAVVAAGAYRPVLQYVRDNGVMANAVALALTPGIVAALLSLRKALSGVTLLAGLACAGVVAAHPSSVVSVGVTAIAVAIGQLASRSFRTSSPQLAKSWALAGLVAVVFAAPSVVGAIGAAGGTSQYPPTVSGVSVAQSLGTIVTVPYGGFLDPGNELIQANLFLLVLIGLVGTLLLRRGLGLMLAWVLWVAITVSLYQDPLRGPAAPIGAFFYNSVGRVAAHVGLLVPGLAAFGALTLAIGTRAAAAVVLRNYRARRDLGARALYELPALAAATAFIVFAVAFVTGPALTYSSRNAAALADLWSSPKFNRVNENDRAASRFLASHVAPNQRVMNSANDGSTYAYVRYGVPVVNISTLGSDGQPYTYELLKSFNTLDTNQAIRDDVVDLNIAWVYVDAGAPVIGSAYTPDNWFPEPLFVLAPGLSNLSALPELSLAFRAGEVSVYRVDLARLRASPAT